jgi:hypothetical protein
VLEGVVLECTLETKEGSTTGCRTAYINVSYDLSNKHYTKMLVMTLIQVQPPAILPPTEAAINPLPEPQQQNETINATPPTAAVLPTSTDTNTTINTTTATPPPLNANEFLNIVNEAITANEVDTFSPAFSRMSSQAEPEPGVIAHEERWFDDPISTSEYINGPVPSKHWGVKTLFDDVYHEGSHRDIIMSRLEVFLLMFPPAQIAVILRETNQILLQRHATILT